MEETEEGIELREVGEEGKRRRNGGFSKPKGDLVEAFLRRRRGGTEIAFIPACCFCGRRLSEDPIPFSMGRELSAEHRRKEHPDVTPRDTQGMRDELERQEKAEKKKRDREKREAEFILHPTGSIASRPGRSRRKTSQSGSKPGPRSKMIPGRVEMACQLYFTGNFSLREISEMSYEFWGVGRHGIGEALKKTGCKLRASRWENNGSRPISRKEAIKLIKSVS